MGVKQTKFEINGRRFQVVGLLEENNSSPKGTEEDTMFFWDNLDKIPPKISETFRDHQFTFNWCKAGEPNKIKVIVWRIGFDGVSMDWMDTSKARVEHTLLLQPIS